MHACTVHVRTSVCTCVYLCIETESLDDVSRCESVGWRSHREQTGWRLVLCRYTNCFRSTYNLWLTLFFVVRLSALALYFRMYLFQMYSPVVLIHLILLVLSQHITVSCSTSLGSHGAIIRFNEQMITSCPIRRNSVEPYWSHIDCVFISIFLRVFVLLLRSYSTASVSF